MKNVDQKCRPKSCIFLKGKKRSTQSSILCYYLLLYISVHISNGGKQKRDADFTETATQEEVFLLRGLVFDFRSARVEKSID